MARFDEAVRDPVLITEAVAVMTSGRLTLPGGATAIGEGFAVIRQHLLDLAGGLSDEALLEASGMGSVFCAQDFHVNPARGPVDHHEQIAMHRFIRHLRQILDICQVPDDCIGSKMGPLLRAREVMELLLALSVTEEAQ